MAADFSLGVAELGTAVNLSGIEKGLDAAESTTKEKSSKFGGLFGGAFAFATGGLITKGIETLSGAVTGFFSGAIGDAREAAQIMAQTEQVIRSTGGAAGLTAEQVADLASSLSAASGHSLFGDDQIQGAENVLLKYRELKGLVPGITQLAVDMAQRLGTEPAAAADTLGRALQKPFDAEAKLAKQGIILTDQQKTMLETMRAAGDTAGAQKFLMDELNKTFGGSAQAAADADGGMAEFNDRMGEAAESLGTALLPLLGVLTAFLLDTVAPAIEQIAAVAIPAMTAAWATVQPAVQFIIDNAEPIGAGLLAIGGVILVSLVPAFIAWASVAAAAALATIVALAPVLIPLAAIGAAVALLTAAWQNDWGGIRTTLTDFWEQTGKPIFETLKTWLDTFLTDALQTLSDFWTGTLQPALDAVWSFIDRYIIPIFNTLVTVYIAMLKAELQALAAFWTNVLKPALDVVWGFLNQYILPILSTLVNVNIAILKAALQTLSDLWTGTLQPALNTVWSFLDTKVIPIFNALVNEHIAAVNGAVAGMATILNDTLKPAFDDVMGFITGTVAPALSNFKTNIVDPIARAFGDIGDAIRDVIRWINDLIDKINSVQIPDWLQGHSPPPMANWFQNIADAAQSASLSIAPIGGQLPALAGGGGAGSGGGGQTLIFNIDARGSAMGASEMERVVRKVVDEAAGKADVFTRTRR